MLNSLFPPLHYALIAAGEGSRLREEGVMTPKPLVKIQGEPMIGRLIRIFVQNGAKSISVICNEQMLEVRRYLESLRESDLLKTESGNGQECYCPLNIIVQTTASSMHSLAALKNVIPDGKFCLTTVDTIFQEQDFSSFIRFFATMDIGKDDGLFAVTPFVDDEKPLWVGVRPRNSFTGACVANERSPEIVGFYDQREQIPEDVDHMVSGGIYCLNTISAFPVLQACLASGQSRMRNYQRALISAGLKLRAYVFPQIMDVDHASDIEKAEKWLSSSKKMLAISRDPIYSPNNKEKDAAIWQSTLSLLRQRGWQIDEFTELDWQKKKRVTQMSDYRKIIHMARHSQSLDLFQQEKIPVLNLAESVRTVAKSRAKTLTLLRDADIPVSDWVCIKSGLQQRVGEASWSTYEFPCWIKVTREEGARSTDIRYFQSCSELETGVQERLSSQDVLEMIITPHLEGEIIKCYAVLEKDSFHPRMFRWFRPLQSGYSKFGEAEAHNNALRNLLIDEDELVALAQRIGKALELQIFGFDLIAQPEGQKTVIDVNDWPSFSICRADAAESIASVIDEA